MPGYCPCHIKLLYRTWKNFGVGRKLVNLVNCWLFANILLASEWQFSVFINVFSVSSLKQFSVIKVL